jgi:hypothetical protein
MDYESDIVFAPDEVIVGGGHTDTQTKTVDHPFAGVPNPAEAGDLPNAHTTPPPQERGIRNSVSMYERSPKRVLFSNVYVYGTINVGDVPGPPNPVKLVDSQNGRKCVVIKCPPSNTKGAFIGHDIDALLGGFTWLVSPNDPPLYLYTEDAVWCLGQTGNAAGDVIQAAVTFDPIES